MSVNSWKRMNYKLPEHFVLDDEDSISRATNLLTETVLFGSKEIQMFSLYKGHEEKVIPGQQLHRGKYGFCHCKQYHREFMKENENELKKFVEYLFHGGWGRKPHVQDYKSYTQRQHWLDRKEVCCCAQSLWYLENGIWVLFHGFWMFLWIFTILVEFFSWNLFCNVFHGCWRIM